MTTALSIQDLTFAYDRRPILDQVNLEITQGTLVGIIGPNGGGKTTLFRLILGFLRPERGAISIFGKPPSEVRAWLAYVPQRLDFDRAFPISTEELVLAGRLRQASWLGRYGKKDRAAAQKALEQVGLTKQREMPFSALSGGQAQRALIARALVSQPRLLLLDEPTAHVDAHAETEIYQLLQELKGSTTILLVTHDFHVATSLVDDVLWVQRRIDRLERAQVCEHFSLGIYHEPLSLEDKN